MHVTMITIDEHIKWILSFNKSNRTIGLRVSEYKRSNLFLCICSTHNLALADAFYFTCQNMQIYFFLSLIEMAIYCGCSDKIFHDWKDTKPSVIPIYKKLIAAGVRIWVYRYMTFETILSISLQVLLYNFLGLLQFCGWSNHLYTNHPKI